MGHGFCPPGIRISAQVTTVRAEVVTAEGEALARCSNASGDRTVVLPEGRMLEGGEGFPGVQARDR